MPICLASLPILPGSAAGAAALKYVHTYILQIEYTYVYTMIYTYIERERDVPFPVVKLKPS